jgi:Histidine kinase-like ATPase domain
MAPPPDAPSPPLPGLRWRRAFPGEARQLTEVRRWLADLLPACAARDDVALVATELASNAVRHTRSGQGSWFAVEITWHRATVRVAVADCGGPSGPPAGTAAARDPAAGHGRGLLAVCGLALRTGTAGDHRGRLMWADVLWPGEDHQPPALVPDPYEAAIRDGQAALASRFTGVPAWFGRATLQWWALPGTGELVTAPTAAALAALLSQVAPRAAPHHAPPPALPRPGTEVA